MNLRERIGLARLNNKVKHHPPRKVVFSGIDKMHHVGIIFDATSVDDFKTIKAFEKKMKQDGRKVSYIGYQHAKSLNPQYIGELNSGFICRKDFNWLNHCTNNWVDGFIQKEFDVLFVLSTNYYFPIHYLSLLSAAYLKVGRTGAFHSDFDLMLDIPQNTPINEQLQHMWRYLEMISKPQKETVAV